MGIGNVTFSLWVSLVVNDNQNDKRDSNDTDTQNEAWIKKEL